jgi:hypothetical protein
LGGIYLLPNIIQKEFNYMDIWNEVVKEFDKEIQRLKNVLGEGHAEDHAHYKQVVGSISGIEWARSQVNNTVKKLTYEEEDN